MAEGPSAMKRIAAACWPVNADDSDFCNDPGSWEYFDVMVNQNPNDFPLPILHELKVGLCGKISQGSISTGPAINLFNDIIDFLIEKRDDADEQILITKIISGAQTGADRAGIDAAIEAVIPYGGWTPKGRRAEDGTVPDTYTELQGLTRGGYPKRTEQNFIDSDGTVIFTYGKLSTGSALTAKLARQHYRTYLHSTQK